MERTVCVDYGTERREGERLGIYTGDLCALLSTSVTVNFYQVCNMSQALKCNKLETSSDYKLQRAREFH